MGKGLRRNVAHSEVGWGDGAVVARVEGREEVARNLLEPEATAIFGLLTQKGKSFTQRDIFYKT